MVVYLCATPNGLLWLLEAGLVGNACCNADHSVVPVILLSENVE